MNSIPNTPNKQPNTQAANIPAAPNLQPLSPAAPSPWTVKPAGGGEPVPIGPYLAVFEGVEPFSNAEKNIVDKWRWSWVVKSGPHSGKRVGALTDQVIKPTTLPGKLISGMAGRALNPNENVEALVDGFKGKTFLVIIAQGPKGGKAGVQSANIPLAM